MAHAEGALGSFTDDGKSRNQQVLKGLAGGNFSLEACGFGL